MITWCWSKIWWCSLPIQRLKKYLNTVIFIWRVSDTLIHNFLSLVLYIKPLKKNLPKAFFPNRFCPILIVYINLFFLILYLIRWFLRWMQSILSGLGRKGKYMRKWTEKKIERIKRHCDVKKQQKKQFWQNTISNNLFADFKHSFDPNSIADKCVSIYKYIYNTIYKCMALVHNMSSHFESQEPIVQPWCNLVAKEDFTACE